MQTDNAWTYTHNNALAALLRSRGIRHRTIPPRMPKRNGKVCVFEWSGCPAGQRGSPRLAV
jgi:hypothetical protein